MRRYTVTVNDHPLVVDVEAVGANLFRVQLDGRLVDVVLDDHRDLAHSPITPALTPRAESSPPPAAPPSSPPAGAVAAGGAVGAGAAGAAYCAAACWAAASICACCCAAWYCCCS